MKRFDRYFLWVFVQSLLLVFLVFTTLFLVVDVLLNLDKLRNFPDVARGALLFYGYNLPPILYLLYPFAVFGAGMFALARILRARELLLLEASGVSPRRALAAIMIPCLLLGALGLGFRQFVLPDLSLAARESPYGAFEFRKGKRITVRDDAGNVWFVKRYNLDDRTLEDVRILDKDGANVVVAKKLQWREDFGVWWSAGETTLYDLQSLTSLDGGGKGKVTIDGQPPFGRLLPADFARRRRGYSDRSLLELWQDSSHENTEMRLNMWHELWYPFGGFILLACGVGLIVGRSGKGLVRAGALSLACVIGYQISMFWFEALAASGAFSPAVGAGITPVLFAIFGGWVFVRS